MLATLLLIPKHSVFANCNFLFISVMSELLFECYGVPGIIYGVDALFSYHYNSEVKPLEDALIVSLGYQTCHVIPVLHNKAIFENARRLNIGGANVISFLQRILQLKYPSHSTAITLSRTEELLHTICEVALDYKEELEKWKDHEYYEKNTKKIQLPFTSTSVSSALTCKFLLDSQQFSLNIQGNFREQIFDHT